MVKCERLVTENAQLLTNLILVFFPLFSFSQAAIQASKEGSKAVTLKHFEWAKVR
jgi:hypothetical protein